MYDDWEYGECPQCGCNDARYFECNCCGGDDVVEYQDHPELWGEDCMSEKNHLVICPECNGTGGHWWCPECSEKRKARQEQGK